MGVGLFIFFCFALLMAGLGGSYILRLIGLIIIGIALIAYFGPQPVETPKTQVYYDGWCMGFAHAYKQGDYSLLQLATVEASRPEWYRIDVGNNYIDCRKEIFR